MNKLKYFFIFLVATVALVSCNKNENDDVVIEPLRDYATQYKTDNDNIEDYLNTYYITVTNSPGNQEDQDVTITKITDPASQPSIMSYLNSSSFPKLLTRNIDLNGITYKMYYLMLREGTKDYPNNTDGVLASYKGEYLTRVEATTTAPIVPAHLTTTLFEEIKFPQSPLDLYSTIRGWSEIFPQFKTGTSSVRADGTIKYENFGAGVLFIPSGLGYYSGSGSIPAYRPLVFSFKLYNLQRLDHDRDGILDMNEDLNGDRYVYDYRNTTLYPNAPKNLDDTDEDGIPNFLDIDDDGDGYTTLLEITKPATEVGGSFGPSKYYPFEPFVVEDDPTTPNINEALNSEPKGIPAFLKTVIGENDVVKNVYDYTSANRLKIHLDKEHNTTKVTTVTK